MVKRLQTAQDKVIRFILSKDARANIQEDDSCSLNILNVHSWAKQLTMFLTFSMRLVSSILDQILLEFLIFIITGLDIVYNKISKFKELLLSTIHENSAEFSRGGHLYLKLDIILVKKFT